MTQIIPRWEFRVFLEYIDEIETRFNTLAKPESKKESADIYIISNSSNDFNVKIRDNLLEIKKLNTKKAGLEQWLPILKKEFPLSSDSIIKTLFPALNTDVLEIKREHYTLQQFLDDLIIKHPQLYIIQASKIITKYTINNCIAEITNVGLNNVEINSACLESTDCDKILETKKMVAMENYENINYIKAIKRTIGME